MSSVRARTRRHAHGKSLTYLRTSVHVFLADSRMYVFLKAGCVGGIKFSAIAARDHFSRHAFKA
jgi:hypothetical protein